jgi:hypothetical protein
MDKPVSRKVAKFAKVAKERKDFALGQVIPPLLRLSTADQKNLT